MAHHIKDIISNVKEISMSSSALNTLLDVERVLDEMNLYAFQNWKVGELIAGPQIGRYRISCTFMWPYSLMPDPTGGERLLKFGVKVKWGKDWLVYPISVESADDYREGTRKPKLARKRVWTVELVIPKHLVRNIQQGVTDVLNSTMDLTDIDSAYDHELDEGGAKGDQTQDQIQDEMQKSMGNEPEGGPGL